MYSSLNLLKYISSATRVSVINRLNWPQYILYV